MEFKEKTPEQIAEMSATEQAKYLEDLQKHQIDQIQKRIEEGEEKNAKEIAKLADDLNDTVSKAVKNNQEVLKQALKEMTVAAEKAKASTTNEKSFETQLKKAFDDKEEEFKQALQRNRSTVGFTIDKAEQTYGDITDGEDFAQMRTGITDIPVRRPRVRNLFSTIPLSTEFYKYVEQETVIRDAQNVAKCTEVTSTTKETLIVRDMTTKVIQDQIDFCRMFVDDYPFMRSRINKLLNESVALREDDQLLTGTGAGEETFSIDSYASEFSAANPVCDLTAGVQDASMVDLILGMQTQIAILGKQEAYQPNVVLVNLCDWFLKVQSRKDLNNNYLDSRVTLINGVPFINGMRVIPLQNVPANTLYVFDSTKAEVLDRMTFEVSVAFENGTNWEKHIASILGFTRINLWCPVNWQNAFMKCTDIDTAVTAITKP